MPWFWIIVTVLVVATGYGLHRLATWAEKRGWVYYRSQERPRAGMNLIGQIYSPAMEHVIEEQQSLRVDEEESGDDPHRFETNPVGR